MATETRLNQLVKGAPPPDGRPPSTIPLPPLSASIDKYSPEPHLAALPSAPPQIYLNLLILESSLRSQHLHLQSRRRLNTFFLLILGLWNSFFIYALFLRPREDGVGLGGSVYWVVETSEKIALMGGTVTVLLVWATGQWERGVRWPRRWLGTTNRGLRGFNLRVVIVRGQWWRETLGHMAFLLPFGLFTEAGGSDWHLVEHDSGAIVEEDLAKGGDHVMLLLLPKSFSPEFRENWEEYRIAYWEKENDRRAGLRRKLKLQRMNKARETGGWKWWTGAWRLIPHRQTRRPHDLEKHPHGGSHHQHTNSRSADATLKAARRRSLMRSDSTHSRQSSRSSTPLGDIDSDKLQQQQQNQQQQQVPLTGERVRRGSSVSSTASVRRKTRDRDRDRGALTMTGSTDKVPRKKDKERPSTPREDGGRLGGVA